MRIRANNKSSAPLMMVLHLSFSGGKSPEAEIIFYPDGEYAVTAALLMRSRREKELLKEGVDVDKEEDVAASLLRLRYGETKDKQTEEWRILTVNDLWEANYMSSPNASEEEMKELYEEYAHYHKKRIELIRDIAKTRIKAGDENAYDDLWAQGLITEQELRDATSI